MRIRIRLTAFLGILVLLGISSRDFLDFIRIGIMIFLFDFRIAEKITNPKMDDRDPDSALSEIMYETERERV